MSSKFDFTARVRSEGKITIPSELREQLNVQQGDFVNVSVQKPEWYEMIDWGQMNSATINLNTLPVEAQNYIITTYSCDSGGSPWRRENV